MTEKITIYTDGACEPNPGIGGWGYIIVPGEITKCGGSIETTNNKMELQAIIEALTDNIGKSLRIYSDSLYAVRGINEWMRSWKANNWMRSTPEGDMEVKNIEQWTAIDDLLKKCPKSEVRWIKAHVGDKYNEIADQLAREGRQNIIDESLDNQMLYGKH